MKIKIMCEFCGSKAKFEKLEGVNVQRIIKDVKPERGWLFGEGWFYSAGMIADGFEKIIDCCPKKSCRGSAEYIKGWHEIKKDYPRAKIHPEAEKNTDDRLKELGLPVGQTHTPGPWKMEYRTWPDSKRKYADAREVQFRGSDGSSISVVMHGRIDDEIGNADARLIAAAPDLLEALHNARARLQMCLKFAPGDMAKDDIKAHMAAIDTAIAKAEGK